MIVLEGPDGSGKTTLAQRLSELLNVGIHHSGGPAQSKDDICQRQHRINTLLREGTIRIHDRVPCISDICYGRILRGGSPLDHQPALSWDFLRVLKLPIIYCRPPMHVIIESTARRPLDEGKQHKSREHTDKVRINLGAIVQEYDRHIGNFPHWTYDYTRSSSTLTVETIVALIRNQVKDLV